MYTVASPNPDPNPRGGGQLPNPKSAILCYKRVDWWGGDTPTFTIYTRGGVNYLTLRVQFYADECNEGRDANP